LWSRSGEREESLCTRKAVIKPKDASNLEASLNNQLYCKERRTKDGNEKGDGG
jgi:hypothetical protein